MHVETFQTFRVVMHGDPFEQAEVSATAFTPDTQQHQVLTLLSVMPIQQEKI